MKMATLLLGLILTCTASATDSWYISNLKEYLDIGVYLGVDDQGEKCIVKVSQYGKLPNKQAGYALYLLEVLGEHNSGWYGLTFEYPFPGGRGDCPIIFIDNGLNLEVQNTGSSTPCFSHPKKSNRKGLKIDRYTNGLIKVTTLDPSKDIESQCLINKRVY